MTEHAPLPMATLAGPDHIVRYANSAFCALMNRTKEELVGKPFAQNAAAKEECLMLLNRVYSTGKSENHREQDDSKTRQVFWSYTMWPVITADRPVGVMIQVTETSKFHEQTLAMTEALMIGLVRQDELIEAANRSNSQLHDQICIRQDAEDALNRAQVLLSDRAGHLEELVAERTAELKTTNEQLESFVYSIAHDLRAPLRCMQGFSALLVDDVATTLSISGRDFANRINKSARFMDDLLRDLLAFSRISQQEAQLTSVNLESVIESVLSNLQNDIEGSNARVEKLGLYPLVKAHQSTLIQVLFNLVSNAMKFAVPGVPAHVRLWAEQRLGFVRVWVEDNGVGIAPAYQTQIFGLFTRLHGEKYLGTGLGLAIVQKGIERMGGQVGVESELGKGCRFWFELRLA